MPHALAEPDPQRLAQEATRRFLNTLAALRGLLHADLGGFSDPSVRDAVTVFSSRIQAFANVHRTLDDEPGESAIDAAAHLARLCQELCAAHLAPRGVHCELRVETAVLPRQVCRNLGLIVAELIANAAQHAFGGRTGGLVWVTLRRGQHGWICQVADNGAGLRARPRGGGLKFVRGLAATLGVELDVRSDAGGVTATVRLPDPNIGRWL
jgi:two-component sensor histidine kinase